VRVCVIIMGHKSSYDATSNGTKWSNCEVTPQLTDFVTCNVVHGLTHAISRKVKSLPVQQQISNAFTTIAAHVRVVVIPSFPIKLIICL